MSKTVDKSGFWFIPHNPISKVGVFDYLGSSISDDCEPNKVYKVFRSGEALLASVPTWDNPPKPFINDHEMLGEGFTEIDERPVQGVITNPQYEDGVLYADITVYSEKLKEAIENGKKELSLGYFCKFEKQPGVYEGEAYDYVQTNMVGNHIALVDAGRCGSDVKVFDQKCVMDSFDIVSKEELKKTDDPATINDEQETEPKEDAMADVRKKIQAILAKDSDDTEKVEELTELVGKPTKDEESEKEEEKKAEDKCGKDEDEVEEKEKKTEDESEEEEKEVKDNDKEEEEKKAEDAKMSLLKKIADGIDELLKKSDEKKEEEKAEDEDEEKETEDEDDEEEKKSEDEDDDSKETGDGILFTFGQDKALDGEDPAIKAYLA